MVMEKITDFDKFQFKYTLKHVFLPDNIGKVIGPTLNMNSSLIGNVESVMERFYGLIFENISFMSWDDEDITYFLQRKRTVEVNNSSNDSFFFNLIPDAQIDEDDASQIYFCFKAKAGSNLYYSSKSSLGEAKTSWEDARVILVV